jgi:type I restriction enzyme M protein
MVEQDWVEAVIGLGPNLFYNSPMEVLHRRLQPAQAGRTQGQGAVHRRGERGHARAGAELPQARAPAAHPGAFKAFADAPGFARVATLAEIARQRRQSVDSAVRERQSASAAAAAGDDQPASLAEAWDAWQESGRAFWQQMDALVETLDGLGVAKEASDA